MKHSHQFYNIKLTAVGFSYIELTVSIMIASILLLGLHNILTTSSKIKDQLSDTNLVINNSKNALQRMVFFAKNSRQLLLPLADNPATDWPENLREETVPASSPIGSSIKSTAVFALLIPDDFDLDKNDQADADDDNDGLINEDLPDDMTNDNAAGIVGIDDDGDGRIDEDIESNDDEDSINTNEEIINNLDDDNDGSIDEDSSEDTNNDNCSGICLLDDDGDGSSDEDSAADDDEDGSIDEDPLNPVVYYLRNSDLIERLPTPWDQNNDSQIDGNDFIESVIAENITRILFERIDTNSASNPLINILIESQSPLTNQTTTMETHIRLGSNL